MPMTSKRQQETAMELTQITQLPQSMIPVRSLHYLQVSGLGIERGRDTTDRTYHCHQTMGKVGEQSLQLTAE